MKKFIIISLLFLSFSSCKKEEISTIVTKHNVEFSVFPKENYYDNGYLIVNNNFINGKFILLNKNTNDTIANDSFNNNYKKNIQIEKNSIVETILIVDKVNELKRPVINIVVDNGKITLTSFNKRQFIYF